MPKNQTARYVVGIGASAGGLKAIQEFFDHISNQTEMAFIIVQHLSPHFKSLMVQLLAKHTDMKVATARNNSPIKKNHVYLIPRNKSLEIRDKHIILTARSKDSKLVLPIDIFFHSLGKEFKNNAVALILSGTGTDGSRGIVTVKENGGLVFIQDPETAQFDGMPNAALQSGTYDGVFSPAKIAKSVSSVKTSNLDSALIYNRFENEKDVILKILQLVKEATEIDYTFYKEATIYRRIEKVMMHEGLSSVKDLYALLSAQESKIHDLNNEFLINVTDFFRDKGAWDFLGDNVINNLIKTVKGREIRVWSVACSTGEEAYSLAMLITEKIELAGKKKEFKIFATDIDKLAIEKASSGYYDKSLVNNISTTRLERFFNRQGKGYKIKKEIRDRIIFATHNAISDPPFTKLDLVTCRNMLIYIENKIQKKLMINLQYALNTSGYLFLGSSEQVGALSDVLKSVDAKWKIWQNTGLSKKTTFELMGNIQLASQNRSLHKPQMQSIKWKPKPIKEKIEEFLLDAYVPQTIVVNGDLDIIYLKGDFKDILSFPQMGDKYNLAKMVNSEIVSSIDTCVKKTISTKQQLILKKAKFGFGKNSIFDLKFGYHRMNEENDELVAIEFSKDITKSKAIVLTDVPADSISKEKIRNLEIELSNTKAKLSEVVEELETSNEELQSSNEELLSSNEELQSTNEELQSVNEELFTVNTELQERFRDMTLLNDDWENLFRSTDIGTIFLDRNFTIRRFTPSITNHFSLQPNDVNRPIEDFKAYFQPMDILSRSMKVLESLEIFEQEVLHVKSGKNFLQRITPYRTTSHTIQGVVVSFIDISKLKKAEIQLDNTEHYYKQVFYGAKELISIFNEKLEMLEMNRSLTGRSVESFLGKGWKTAIPGDHSKLEKALVECLKNGDDQKIELSVPHAEDNSILHFIINVVRFELNSGELRLMLTAMDVTEEVNLRNEALEKTLLLENMNATVPMLIYIYDIEKQKNIYTNRELSSYLGYTTEEFRNLPNGVLDIIPKSSLKRIANHQKLIQNDKINDVYYLEYQLKHKDGSLMWFSAWDKPFKRDKNGKVIQNIGATFNNTENKEIQDQLQFTVDALKEREDLLKRSNEQLEQFAYVASHDLQEPIRHVSQFLQFLTEHLGDNKDEKTEEYIKIVVNSAERMRNLINGLLKFSKMNSQPLYINSAPGSDIIQKALDMNTLSIVESKADIRYSAKIPDIECDFILIGQLFQNLLSNSIKFSKKGTTPKINISYKSDGFYHEFCVEDNGIGIAKDGLEAVFMIFKRLHNAKKYSGHGLGMTLARRIVERHGGNIWIESELGVGTKVFFTLPKKIKKTKLTADENFAYR